MEEQKKYFIISTILFVIIAIVILQVDKYHDNKVRNSYTLETNKLNNQYINVNDFGIYSQNEKDKTKYDKQASNDYPTSGYVLNTSRTKCFDYHGREVKGKVSQTDEGRVRLETTVSIYCQMYFDIDDDAPSITSMSIIGTDKDGNSNSNYIYDYKISYTVTWEDSDVVYYCVKEGSSTCNESDWQKTNGATTKNGTITVTTEGPKTIYAYIRDRARNVSQVASKTITVDRTAPKVTLSLTGTADTGQTLINGDTYTQTKNITYTASITEDNMEGYCIGEGNCTSYINSTNKTFTNVGISVNDTEGLKTIKINVKDKAGNVGSASKTITLDKTNPVVSISGDTSTENTITFTISASDSNGSVTTSCRAVGGSKTINGTINSNKCTINGLSENTSYTIYAKAVDLSGRYKEVNKTVVTKTTNPGEYVKSKNPAGLNKTKVLGGLYRFVGSCNAANGGCTSTVDNFICFGTDDPANDCTGKVNSDYMYRIIGIDPSTGDLKLIKNTYITELGSYQYAWYSSSAGNVSWPSTSLIKRLNGKASGGTGQTNIFIDSKTSNVQYIMSDPTNPNYKWYDMIKDTEWKYGDIGYNGSSYEVDKTADEIYQIETGSKSTVSGWNFGTSTWANSTPAKVGLMYLHDFYYSYAKSGIDSSKTNCYTTSAGCEYSWLDVDMNGVASGNSDWTMSRFGLDSSYWYLAWFIGGTDAGTGGSIFSHTINTPISIRPVFYLDSTKSKLTGSGTYEVPFVAMPTKTQTNP